MLILLVLGDHYDLLVATMTGAAAWYAAVAGLVVRYTARR